METRAFTDPSVKPDDKLIHSIIGEKLALWNEFTQYLFENYTDVKLEWKFYKDAKSWLLPVEIRKKNIAWVTIIDRTFRVSFWFGKKLETHVEQSDLPEEIIELYRKADQNKMGRGLSIFVNTRKDMEYIKRLLDFKSKFK